MSEDEIAGTVFRSLDIYKGMLQEALQKEELPSEEREFFEQEIRVVEGLFEAFTEKEDGHEDKRGFDGSSDAVHERIASSS